MPSILPLLVCTLPFMSSTDIQTQRQRAKALQGAFFAAPNRCDPSAISDDPQAQNALQACLKRHASGAVDRGVLLPFRDTATGPTAWFVCASSMQMLRALQDEVRAFIGPSYAAERAQSRPLDAADQHALPLIEAQGWFSLRLDSSDLRSDTRLLSQWHLYEELLSRRPRVPSYVPSTFHQIRASFDRALLARNEAEAQVAMAAMRERFGVSAENRLYLEIRLSAAFERWDAIAQHPLLPRLIHLQLPPETYGDVMEALYRSHAQVYEAGPLLEPLLDQFRTEIGIAAQPLFKTRRTSRRPAVLKAFVLQELLQDEPQWAVCERILHELPTGSFGAVDALVRQRCSGIPRAPDFETAREALDNEQFDRAWELLWALPDSVDVLRGLIACARESADPAKTAEVLTRLGAAEAFIRSAVEAASAMRLTNLRASYRPPDALTERLPPYKRWPEEPEERYIERWAEFVRSVEPAALLADKDTVKSAVECLIHYAVEDPALFERLYPLWHELFIERVDPTPLLVPVYQEMLEALRARDVFQRTDLELLHQILVAIVDSGDDASYQQAVDTVCKVFDAVRAPRAMGWALDVCDSLSQRRVRDADARLRLLTQVIQACQEFASRLDPLQTYQLRLLAMEARLDPPKLPEAATAPHDEEHAPDQTPYRVVIYSLDEAATRRAVEILKSIKPHWMIDTNADQVCTDRLKTLAHKANVFVFAWRCSKHAAYYCVKASTQKENLVMARGVGTTSLVSAAVEFLRDRSA
jgi:hypothetical protein